MIFVSIPQQHGRLTALGRGRCRLIACLQAIFKDTRCHQEVVDGVVMVSGTDAVAMTADALLSAINTSTTAGKVTSSIMRPANNRCNHVGTESPHRSSRISLQRTDTDTAGVDAFGSNSREHPVKHSLFLADAAPEFVRGSPTERARPDQTLRVSQGTVDRSTAAPNTL
jgi:hypothetical protein